MQIRHAAQNARSRLIGQNRKMPGRSCGAKPLDLRGLPFLPANPDLFEQMVEADFVIAGNRRAAITGVGQRAGERVARAMLQRVKVQSAVSEVDAAVRLPRDIW